MSSTNSLIIGWRLKGRHVLIIGGNHIIANRIEFILDTKPEKITLISPKQKITSNKVTSYINNDLVIYKNKEFHVDDLTTEKIDLILASIDNDLKLSEKIAATAREQKIPINVAELPQLCDFWFMPTYRDGNLQVAISTNGTGPHIAQKLRQHIIENIPKNISNAIGNAALLKQLVSTANISTLTKIADKLSLNQLAQLSEPEIKKLIGTNESNDNDLVSISKSILSLKSKIGIEINTHEGGGLKLVNGSTAIEHVAYALTSSIFIYPATRSHYLGELSLYWSSQSLNNAFGEINHVIKADTRFGASTMIFGAASNVKRISAFASSQSIIPMIPNFYGIVDEKIPFVIHVSALDNDDQMNYYVNYHNLLIAHETGFGIINSYSIQEAHDIALITHLASVYLKSPFLHVFDGLKVLNKSTKINLLSYSNILRLNKELSNMTENLKSFDENNDDDKVNIIEMIANKVSKKSANQNKYHAFEYFGSEDAEKILIVLGSEINAIKNFVSSIDGYKSGAVVVRLYRPWSERKFLEKIPKTVKQIGVMEQVNNHVNDNPASYYGLFNDVVASFNSGLWTDNLPALVNVKFSSFDTLSSENIGFLFNQLGKKDFVDVNEFVSEKINISSISKGVNRCIFWDSESQETITVNKHIANILANHSNLNISNLSTYDIYNNGGVIKSELQFSAVSPVDGIYATEENDIDYIFINDFSLTSKYNILSCIKNGGVVLLNTKLTVDELETKLPNDFRYEAAKHNIQLYLIDSEMIIQDLGLNFDVDSIRSLPLQIATINLIKNELKLDYSLESCIAELYEISNGSDDCNDEHKIVNLVSEVIQKTQKSLVSIELPPTWLILEKSDQIMPTTVQNNSLGPNLDKSIVTLEKSKLSTWHSIAFNLLFKEAYKTVEEVRPDILEKTYIIKVTENKRLTPLEYDRFLFHIEFDISGTGLQYELGEALGVYGHNDTYEVNHFLEFYKLNPNDFISVPNKECDKYETKTIFQIFSQVLDIFGRPTKKFYESLAMYATDENEKNKLLWISSSEGSNEFKRRVEDTITYAELLYEFTSARPPVEELIQLIAPIKPRHYSIASAQSVHPNSVHLLVVTVEWANSAGKKRYGQCTHYLSRLKIGESLTVSIKPSVMKLPPRDTQPVIMAGLGTGMAPFRAFIEERAYRQSQGIEVGPMILYFGSRHRSMEYLYGEELEAYHVEGLLTHLRLAFSRDQKHKIYIQHKMEEDGDLLHQYLLKDEGWFYLCGPTWPVSDVKDAIVGSFVKSGGLTLGEATNWVNKLKDLERYILEERSLKIKRKEIISLSSHSLTILPTSTPKAIPINSNNQRDEKFDNRRNETSSTTKTTPDITSTTNPPSHTRRLKK
ncbi:15531_t:CDS:2 [Entrophospora sp. SA101]|nr:15531_t:CDS:2 [Entrophospora sp. SA101]